MRHLKKFPLFESEEDLKFTYEDLSPEAKENARERVREAMYRGEYGADDIPSWVIDDDYLFEPTHKEMEGVFGPNYNDDLNGRPMIGNERKGIYFVSKDDRNYYLHCADALIINNENMFLGWLGIPPYFWETLYFSFRDGGTYTQIEFEIEDEDDLTSDELTALEKEIEKAEEKFEDHMSDILTRITNDIERQFEDQDEIEMRIESNEILFDEEGDPLD